MNFLEELKWRGMLQDSTPGVEELLENGMVTGYIGFDPTAPSMTIGNFVQIMLLKLLQLSGHQPIVLMGGATGRIGDPSGKDEERQLKSYEELDSNLGFQLEQMKKFLDFDGPNKAIVVNNYDFYKDFNVLDFLREVGKTLTVNYMTSKESVKKRLETGLSFTEFSYQLLQAYDFQKLYQLHHCKLQMGGSDQWGNITSGTEFIRRNLGEKAYAVTTPLLTKSDGKKFGKSEKGNIWLDARLTSPYRFYQFWLQCDDADLPKFFRYFTLKSKDEVEALEQEYSDNPRALKAILAEELTIRVHSQDAFESVRKVTELLFGRSSNHESLKGLTIEELEMVKGELTPMSIEKSLLVEGLNILDLLVEHTQIFSSKGDARRTIKNNGVSLNKNKVTSHELVVGMDSLLHSRFLMIEKGKKNKFLIELVD